MQKQETVAARRRTVALVQTGDAFLGGGQQLFVALRLLARCIGPVGQQRKMKVARGARQIVDFELSNLLLDVLGRGQEGRYGDERAQVLGDSAAQFQRRQQGSAKTPGHNAVDECDGCVDRWDQS